MNKYLFRAPDWRSQRFVVLEIVRGIFLRTNTSTPYIHSLARRKFVTAAITFTTITISALFITTTVESNLTFARKLDRLLVLPGVSESTVWKNSHHALTQDVDDEGLYQNFSSENAAVLDAAALRRSIHSTDEVMDSDATPSEIEPSDSSTQETTVVEEVLTEETEIIPETLNTEEVPESVVPQTNEASEEVSDPDTDAEPEVTPAADVSDVSDDAAASSEDTPLEAMSKSFFRFVDRATRLLPFAQESIVEPVLEPLPEPETDSLAEESVSETTEVSEDSGSENIGEAPAVPEEDQGGEVIETIPVEDVAPVLPEDEILELPEVSEGVGSGTVQEESVAEEVASEALSESENWITFRDFGLPPLNSGQFIRNVQLRLSLAGALKESVAVLPQIVVEYTTGGAWESAGNIIFDTEISNALNGGYYLFALPTFRNVSELENFEVRISYEGDSEILDTLLIDAAWLEVNTETFDREILNQRLNPLGFKGFKMPEMYEYIGTAIDFARDELPQFTLKYESQRNPVVGFLRDLFGRKLIEIERVSFMLPSGKEIGVDPDVDLTDDGLLSIQLTEEDKALLQPGKYEVEITVLEGSKEYTDSFNFQWGVLAINPDHTTYPLGATATITIGAVSENGNTLCEADLQLYVFDPTGYVHDAPVERSGLCNGNNFIDNPDYFATFTPSVPGTYEMYLEHIGTQGDVVAHTYDTFVVRENTPLTLERVGPTRINPRFEYPMSITVTAFEDFEGKLIERVPFDFVISSTTDARIEDRGNVQELSWDVTLRAGESQTFTYDFDAPDISPYLYNLGPAQAQSGDGLIVHESLVGESYLAQESVVEPNGTQPEASTPEPIDGFETIPEPEPIEIEPDSLPVSESEEVLIETPTEESLTETPQAISTETEDVSATDVEESLGEDKQIILDEQVEGVPVDAGIDPSTTEASSTTDVVPEGETSKDFEEHRQWQIASDATGSALLYWDSASIPSGWTCVSCAPAGSFYQRFVLGSSTAGTNGGAATHTHTMTTAVQPTGSTGVSNTGNGGADAAQLGHGHSLTPTIGTGSTLPPYRNLVLIQHNSAGVPTTIPAGAIALFDATLPSGWSAYSAQNGLFPRAEATSTIGTTGGTSTHAHSITGTTGAPDSTTNAPGTSGVSTAGNTHTHTVNGTSSIGSNLPPYIGTIFGQLGTSSAPTDGMILMWTDEAPSGWVTLSSSSGPFENRFVVASTTYGTIGGSETHSHTDFSVVTSGPSASVNRTANAANADASGSHTHDVDFSSVSTVNHLPPFRTAVFAKNTPGGAVPTAPVIHTPFDNEKTGTSTIVFEFTGDDPDGTDTLVYQVQWDDDADLDTTPLGDHTSDDESGCSPDCFENIVDGGDTNPFTDNERIRFTAPTAMVSGTTYYYRIRVKETIGDTWSSWSPIQSVTHESDIDISEWFQTEDYQFGLGTFTNATATSNTVEIASTTDTSLPTIQSFTSSTTVPGALLTLDKPSNVLPGDLLLIIVGNDDDSASAQWDDATLKPTGFTLINEAGNTTADTHAAAFYRIADGSEGLTIDVPAQSSDDFWGYYIHVTDANQLNPVHVIGSAYNGGGSGTHDIPSVTTTIDNTLAFYVLSGDGGDMDPYSVASPWSESAETDAGTGFGNSSGAWGTRTMTTSGATGDASVSMSGSDSASGFQFAIAPALGQGSLVSSGVVFSSVPGQTSWGEATWQVNEPTNTDIRVRVLYTSTTTCDSVVSEGVLPGNSIGFTSSQTPLNLTSLSTSTHHTICLEALLDLGTGVSSPALEDWTIRWTQTPQFVQSDYRWYVNNGTTTPTDPWPAGGNDLEENEPIDADSILSQGDNIRLRISLMSTSTDAPSDSTSFRLQYAAADSCDAADSWHDVGGTASTTALWRGYNNASVADATNLPSTLLTNSDHAETYEEQNNSFPNPVAIDVGEIGEWDWTLEHNGASAGTVYCFRMAHTNGDPLIGYTNYPTLVTDASPTMILYRPFDNEKTASTSPWFEFVGDDAEGDDVDYQIQIDNDATFSSTLIDTDSATNLTDFVNLVTPSDKSPFRVAERMRYYIPSALSNGTTYWWRVRSIDAAGSGAYGEWSSAQSFTVDTSVTVSTWFQTTEAQFDTNTLLGTDATGGNLVTFASGSSTGTTTSTAIDFDNATIGNAWGEFVFNETGSANDILYRLEYYNGSDWELIPDSALSGNAAGFDTSPVDLLGLDSATYNTIRIRANFLAGSPTLLDWTIEWGERVSVPTHVAPFNNEKFSTTTPFFTFSTTDPEDEDLEYEISWSTDVSFVAGSTTRNSNTDAGFINLLDGGDTDPFNSGDTIQFQIQPADALAADTTYWWRVRAKDPAGSDSFSFWSTPWSFTTATSGEAVDVSTWYQTTDDQFSGDTLVNVTAATGSVSIGGGINIQNWTTNTAVPGSSLSLTRPAGVIPGDLLIIIVGNDDNTATQQWNSTTLRPSGFNFINTAGSGTSDAHAAAFYRIADGTEASSTSTPAQSSDDYWGYYIRVTGVSTSSPIDTIGSDYVGGSSGTHNITAITTAVDQALAFYAISADGGDVDPFSVAGPWVEQAETEAGTGIGNAAGAWGTRLMTTAGDTGDAAVTMSASDGASGFQFSLTPAVITSGTITSQPIDYDEGDGPAWGVFSWNDVEPGSSEIRYRIEYLNMVDVWESIPDGALAGNSAGFTTAPIDLQSLDTGTYNTIRIVASLNCAGANCPTLNDWTVTWSSGFTVSGTAYEYDGVASTTSGTVAIAINGAVQSGKTGAISNGLWSIPNVTFYEDDIITIFVQGAADADEAVAVTQYDGTPGISGVRLQKRHLSIGSDDLASITNADLALYDFTNTEDIFFNVDGGNDLTLCADTGCVDASVYIRVGNTYTSGTGADITMHDLRNHGTFILGSNTVRVSGSWLNGATTTMTGSTVIFTATSSTETLDDTDGILDFSTLTFGEGSGTATWSIQDTLDVEGALSVTYGTLDRSTQSISVVGNLTTGVNGFWTGIGTTTFDGINPSTWTDNNATKQNIGHVVVDGTSKTMLLGTNVVMDSIRIAGDDTFDLSISGHTASVYRSWTNLGSFLPRTGTVAFIATSSNYTIDNGAHAFYNLTFNGAGGAWSFATSALTIQNNFTIATGTVTMPTGTTTISGSFLNTGGTFAHNNANILFTGSGSKTITQSGTAFTNAFYNVRFTGTGSWTFSEPNATTTNNFTITQGGVTLPSSALGIGNSFAQTGGSFTHNSGTVRFTGSATHTIDINGSSFNDLAFTGTGSWAFVDASVTTLGDLLVQDGTLTMPTGTLSLGGSLTNAASILHASGTILFNSTDTGETINLGSSSLHNLTFNSGTGGWIITEHATTTGNVTLTTLSSFTLDAGRTLSVSGNFSNNVGGASTTWSGATLSLESGSYSINTKTNPGDVYGTLRVAAGADIRMWHSTSTDYTVDATGSLYSQDHDGVDGELYIWGNYERTSGTEYWSYATDFDGASLVGGSERQAHVFFAQGGGATITNATVQITGDPLASTTIQNQGTGTYTLLVADSTLDAEYYQIRNTDATGLSLSGSTTITSLEHGDLELGTNGGSLMTVASTTINHNPALQIQYVRFATSTGITSGTNVTQSGAAPISYWWFRNTGGNLAGEAFDNDTGDPGSVRWDDSQILITVSGTVYSDDGVTTMAAPVCDGSTQNVRVVVNGSTSFTGSCDAGTGAYSIPNVSFAGDPILTVYLDTNGGARGVTVTKTPTSDLSGFDIYQDRVITRHEDVSPLTILDMAIFDADNDTDIPFTAATGTLSILSETELHIASSTTFAPGGDITIQGNASSSVADGSLHIDNNAHLLGSGTSTYTIGGSFTMDQGGSFTYASTTVVMNATTSGKTITTTSGQEITFNTLQFTGTGGGWNINGNIRALNGIAVTNGTVSGTADITVTGGSLGGNGTVSMGGGTTTIATTNTLGGTTPWTFNNLVLGNGLVAGTTTLATNATSTILGRLTIGTAHTLAAGGARIDLRGTGTVFVENGVFAEGTSTVRYSGTAGSNVLSTTYYDLEIMALGNAPTFVGSGLGIIVSNNLTAGGATTTTFTLDTSDPVFDVNGSVQIHPNGILVGSASAAFTVAGNWDNDGVFTASGGTVTFDGSSASLIAAGSSSFANVLINGSGSFTFTEHATTTSALTLSNAGAFTLASGQTLAVGGVFTNGISGGLTTWTGSTLSLYGGGSYTINATTTSDVYETLRVNSNTQIRMWNSSAAAYDIASTGSLYSQDHGNTNGELRIFGLYQKTSGTDHWSYTTDFDGTDIGGSPRVVSVLIADTGVVRYTGGGLSVIGGAGATTTIENQGSGTYALEVGGTASTTWSRFSIRDTNTGGLTFGGAPTVNTLAFGDFEVTQDSASAMTVGGTVITQNPAKTFTNMYFGTSTGVTSAYNVTATGTTVSSWRFTNHTGTIDGESFDNDPTGDPGYLVWDDSAALITISGNVYSDEGVTVSGICDDVTQNIHVRVAGLTSYATSCNSGTGAYSVPNVSFGPADSVVVFIDGETEKAAAVTVDPVSNITDMHLYENRVIVRHENSSPISIADMEVWDSSDDGDIPFTATLGAPNTLTLPADRKLIVWTNKEFEPGGNVTVSGGGGGAPQDGTLELYTNATFDATGSESHSIGGSFIMGSGTSFDDETSTMTFTTSGAARTIDTNDQGFYNVVFNGTGSWTVANSVLSIGGDVTITQGAVTLPSGTTTVSGSLLNNGGSFVSSGGTMVFDSGSSEVIRPSNSSFGTLLISGNGSFTLSGGYATTTSDLRIENGSFTSATGTFAIGGNFINNDSFAHANGTVRFTSNAATVVTASSSDLAHVTFAGDGPYTFTDTDLALLGTLRIDDGAVTLPTDTLSIGGSLLNNGGTFDTGTGTVLFNSTDTGETVNPGPSAFYNVAFGSASGGWIIGAHATATGNFALTSASQFTMSSSTTLYVGGVFTNLVGGGATTWTGSTLSIHSGTPYTINTKAAGGDAYNNLVIGSSTALRAWDSSGVVSIADSDSSFYSQDHAGVSGALNIYGNYGRTTGTDYWSYATDFDGTALGGGSRQVSVAIAGGATTTFSSSASLQIVGANGFETAISHQGSGTYAMRILGGTFNALQYTFANMDAVGLALQGTTTVASLSEGSFTLGVNGGALISLASTTLNYNAGLVVANTSFATTSAITGFNVALTGTTSNAWNFISHSGNLAGEQYDFDGGDDCGSVRWEDSLCLLTEQSGYRFRADDGGAGVPDAEWLDQDWVKRMRVTLVNEDPVSYTDAAVAFNVAYDSDMQADFDDLRFTLADGTTPIDHFIETYSAGSEAQVWVNLPLLATSTNTSVFMYYGNGSVGDTSTTSTFTFIDPFEDGNISEYSGDTSLFTAGTNFPYERTRGLDADGNESQKTTDGIYRTDVTVAQGETIRHLQYIDTTLGSGDETCTLFGVQSPGSNNENYAVCLELFGVDRVSISRDVDSNDTSGTVLASTTISYSTGWYEVEIDWGTDDSITVSVSQNDVVVATTTATDGTYTQGGIGFAFWFQSGGWDIYSSRPTLETEPSVIFGAEQVSGGASWLSALNTAYTGGDIGETVRVRFLVENTGLAIVDQNYEIEYAAKGASPSCEAVSGASYIPVPPQASCGTSPICMTSSSQFTSLSPTVDLLGGEGTFTSGQMVEDPDNTTGDLDVDTDSFTELEYAVIPTVNVADSNYCFRVSDEGNDLDAYARVAEFSLMFEPNITTLSLNGGNDIILSAGGTTTITATGTVSDLNGYNDLGAATTTIFRSGAGETCAADNNNCYIAAPAQCSYSDCAGSSCTVSCSVDMYYHADPTDIGTYAGETWRALLSIADMGGATATATAPSIDLLTLRALSVESAIDYGALAPDSDTGSYNATTTVQNIGNDSIDVAVEGTDLTDGGSSAIPVSGQRFATSTFTYSSCVVCGTLDEIATNFPLDLAKPASTTPPITDDLFWGIAVPFGVAGTPHYGTNIFYAIDDI